MKKPIKLAVFNIAFIIIAILSFSERGLGLSFDPSDGAFSFAMSISLTFLGIGLFCLVNYTLLTKKEKVDYKIKKLSTISDCITALEKCKHTDPAFLEEIKEAIGQLQTLKRKADSLATLLEQNGVSENFASINKTADKAKFFVFENVKRIINRLIVFDNEEYLAKGQSYDISEHRNYICNILRDNDDILHEYQEMLLAVSGVGDIHQTNLAELQIMTEALNRVLGGKQFASLEKKYAETNNLATKI